MAVKINVAIGPYLKLVKEYQRTQDPETKKAIKEYQKLLDAADTVILTPSGEN